MTARWHIVEAAGEMTLCRQLPPRFDVAATAHLPPARPVRLAHQIRQDLWRALAHVRGFSPVVRLAPSDTGWRVTAVGRVMGRIPPAVEGTIDALLNDATKRARWVRNARVTR